MSGFWLFLHYMGVVAWLGGGLAVMLSGITAKHFPPEQRLAVYRATSVVARNLIGPGAVLTVVSGFILSVPYFKCHGPDWLMVCSTGPHWRDHRSRDRHADRRAVGRLTSIRGRAAGGFHQFEAPAGNLRDTGRNLRAASADGGNGLSSVGTARSRAAGTLGHFASGRAHQRPSSMMA